MNEKELTEKIVVFLRQNGPSHPVQIGKILGKDGLMTSAILSEVIKRGPVKRTERNVGNSPLYFIDGQEEMSKKMVMDSLGLVEKKFVERVKVSSFVFHSDLSTQDKFVLPGLKDFLIPLKIKLGDKETIIWKYYSVPNEKILPSVTEKLKSETVGKEPEKISEEKIPVSREMPKRDESIFGKKAEQSKDIEKETEIPISGFQNSVENWLSRNDADIIKREVKRKGKELEYFIRLKSALGQEYFVKCKDKKRVSESDISLTYTEAMQKKIPAIFITSGKVSKKILNTIDKKFGGLIKIIVL